MLTACQHPLLVVSTHPIDPRSRPGFSTRTAVHRPDRPRRRNEATCQNGSPTPEPSRSRPRRLDRRSERQGSAVGPPGVPRAKTNPNRRVNGTRNEPKSERQRRTKRTQPTPDPTCETNPSGPDVPKFSLVVRPAQRRRTNPRKSSKLFCVNSLQKPWKAHRRRPGRDQWRLSKSLRPVNRAQSPLSSTTGSASMRAS
ncbi:hypothetical protein BH23PLA1_BH23PLA1_02600 [soil metagenome]